MRRLHLLVSSHEAKKQQNQGAKCPFFPPFFSVPSTRRPQTIQRHGNLTQPRQITTQLLLWPALSTTQSMRLAIPSTIVRWKGVFLQGTAGQKLKDMKPIYS